MVERTTDTVDAPRPEDPRAILRRHGLRPKRSWGQNFLINLALVERMATEISGHDVEQVIEIGAGLGTLTAALASRVPKVIALERDPDMVDVLRQERPSWGGDVEIVAADAVKLDYRALTSGRRTALVGNLPYQLTGRLLRRVVETRDEIELAVVMVQAEVAQRLRAKPGVKAYGVLGVMCQAWFDIAQLWRVSPGSFHPRPKVSSIVVRLVPSVEPRVGTLSEADFSQLVHAAFGARRKTLANTLSSVFAKDDVLAALESEGIDPSRRAETLEVEQLAALAVRLITPEAPR